jgi:hypothetical protein
MVFISYAYRALLTSSFVQTGAVCVFTQDQGKLELQMTAGVHARTFAALRNEGILHPSQAAYQQHFSRMWDEGMSAHNAKLLEKNWTTLERVLAPYYFERRDWTPKLFTHLDKKCVDYFRGRHSFNRLSCILLMSCTCHSLWPSFHIEF